MILSKLIPGTEHNDRDRQHPEPEQLTLYNRDHYIASVDAHMASKQLILRVWRQCNFMQNSTACLCLVYSECATLCLDQTA